jgi:hypothetical protein
LQRLRIEGIEAAGRANGLEGPLQVPGNEQTPLQLYVALG